MRKIREVFRLRFELGLEQRAIARACSISQSTVHDYLKRAAAAGLVWPLGEEWDEQRVEQALFGERQVVKRLPEQVLQSDPILWVCPITEVVSLLSDGPGNDVDLPW